MTKMIKLSLAAAVAVAGFTTSAAAADLSNTSFSGKVEFEYDMTDNGNDVTTNTYDLDIDVKAKTKISDTWTSIVVVQADQNSDVQTGATPMRNKSAVDVPAMLFQYSNGTTTAKIGRQGGLNATPYFDDERGDGVIALHTLGSVTLAAAHVDNVNAAINNEAVTAIAAIGSFGSVNASLWHAEVGELDSNSLNVNSKFGTVSAALTHTVLNTGAANAEDNTLTKVVVSAPVGPVTLTGAFGVTAEDGGTVAFNNDASAAFTLDQLSLNGVADASAMLVAVSGKVGAATASLALLSGSAGDTDLAETQVKVAYPLAKALKLTSAYSTATIGDADATIEASVALEYKF